jgi:NAD-dependent SIR2 family protein deacetylase
MAKQVCANCGHETSKPQVVEVFSGDRLELCLPMCPRCHQALGKYLSEFEEDLTPDISEV